MADLRKVQRAAMKVAASRATLENEIREAHANGQSLRKIAEVAAMSHEQVRVIVSR